jgi:hypothetical protein
MYIILSSGSIGLSYVYYALHSFLNTSIILNVQKLLELTYIPYSEKIKKEAYEITLPYVYPPPNS